MDRAAFLRRAGALLLAPTLGSLTRNLPVAARRLDYKTIVTTPIQPGLFAPADSIVNELTGERLIVTAISSEGFTVTRNIERRFYYGAAAT